MATRAKVLGLGESEMELDISSLHEKFSRSEVSQQELASRVGRMEGQLEENSHAMGKLTNMLESLLTTVRMEKGENSATAQFRGEKPKFRVDTRRPFVEELGGDESTGDKDNRTGDSQIQPQRAFLPRVDFPVFNGTNPVDWVEESDFYFECYQVAENYKSRMASMHFTGDAREWYRSFKINNQHPPWLILKEEVLSHFVNEVGKPMEEFKRVHQTGKVDEYVTNFMRAKARLMQRTQIDHEDFYVGSFIGGLKEEIRNSIDLFETPTLKIAISYARKIEVTIDGSTKRWSSYKPPTVQRVIKGTETVQFRRLGEGPQKALTHNPTQLTIEQKKSMGLCFKCNEKYHYGHKCVGKGLHSLEADLGEEEPVTEEYEGLTVEEIVEEPEVDQPDQATISVCVHNAGINTDTPRFKGQLGHIPICALVDSGSTHSFISPVVISAINLKGKPTSPVSFRVANGQKMFSTMLCTGVIFTLQGKEIEADLRVLDVPGYDIILGVDWMKKFGSKIDYDEGTVCLKHKGQPVKLVMEEVVAEIRLTEQEVNVQKERKKGNQVIVAQLFSITEERKEVAVKDPKVQTILDEFGSVFQEPTALPPTRPVDHKIPLKDDSKPIALRPYRFSYFQRLELEKIVTELQKNSLIQPSHSSYSSPVLLVKKKDGSWRMCVDFRRLNDNTIKHKFPIPIIDDLLDELKDAVYFSKLDLRSGYHQIRMCEEDKHKTAFQTHDGLYEFNVMPFGLTNAPATFQSLMNSIFKPHLRKFILVFFDDILIYSQDLPTHLSHLRKTLQILKDNNLFVKMSKCDFGVTQIEYLGHVISNGGVATDPKKIEAMVQWPVPKTLKELRGFLGLTGYYRKFVKGYSIISRPLTDLLKKNAFKWSSEAQTAFQRIKDAMVQAPVLALPDFTQPFIVETDACKDGIGAVLQQGRRPVAYISQKLSPSKQDLSTYEKEFLALVVAVTKWRHYLMGGKFVIRTDHISLKYLVEQKIHTATQHKGLSKLLGLDFVIEYKKGCENVVADSLSRREGGKMGNEGEKGIASVLAVVEIQPTWMEGIHKSYEGDKWIEKLRDQKKLEEEEGSNSQVSEQSGLLKYKDRICVGSFGNWRL